jgi:hypothetical protein
VVGDAGTVVAAYDPVDAWQDANPGEVSTDVPGLKKYRVRDRFAAAPQVKSFVDHVKTMT